MANSHKNIVVQLILAVTCGHGIVFTLKYDRDETVFFILIDYVSCKRSVLEKNNGVCLNRLEEILRRENLLIASQEKAAILHEHLWNNFSINMPFGRDAVRKVARTGHWN